METIGIFHVRPSQAGRMGAVEEELRKHIPPLEPPTSIASISRSAVQITDSSHQPVYKRKRPGATSAQQEIIGHVLCTKKGSGCDRIFPDCMVICVFAISKTSGRQRRQTLRKTTQAWSLSTAKYPLHNVSGASWTMATGMRPILAQGPSFLSCHSPEKGAPSKPLHVYQQQLYIYQGLPAQLIHQTISCTQYGAAWTASPALQGSSQMMKTMRGSWRC